MNEVASRRRHGMALAGLVLAGAVCCSRSDPKPVPASTATATTAPAPSASASSGGLVLPSVTSASIAMSNLDGETDDARKRADHGDPIYLARLVDHLLMRAQYTGSDADLTEADERTKKDVLAHPKDGAAHQRRASALSSLHEFTAATAELDAAVANGIPAAATSRARATIAIALGDYDRAATLFGPVDGATVDVLVLHGALAQHRGSITEAETLFEKSRTTYRDVSPFFVAWSDFERARALSRAGNDKSAKLYFREAVMILPLYAHAASHLVAMETPEAALEILKPFADTNEAGILAARADTLRRAGKNPEADAATTAAAARFDELLKAHPLAYADHAATFYLGAGKDVARALVLAKRNADNRPNEEALELWLTAAEAAKSTPDACAAAAKIKAFHYAEPALVARATAVKACP